jgi:hypothetical protein
MVAAELHKNDATRLFLKLTKKESNAGVKMVVVNFAL